MKHFSELPSFSVKILGAGNLYIGLRYELRGYSTFDANNQNVSFSSAVFVFFFWFVVNELI